MSIKLARNTDLLQHLKPRCPTSYLGQSQRPIKPEHTVLVLKASSAHFETEVGGGRGQLSPENLCPRDLCPRTVCPRPCPRSPIFNFSVPVPVPGPRFSKFVSPSLSPVPVFQKFCPRPCPHLKFCINFVPVPVPSPFRISSGRSRISPHFCPEFNFFA